MNDLELHEFYENLVRRLRSKGVLCAITGSLACVHYGIAESTKDCDLLCHPASFEKLLALLVRTKVEETPCQYRGNISPPLDARWHRGGWTSHFEWDAPAGKVKLDVFGHGLRESRPWAGDLLGFYAGPGTVAAMKRTNRDKDWPFVDSLGVRMIEAGNDEGWLHLFERDNLLRMLERHDCPDAVVRLRPSLKLAREKDSRLAGALLAERLLWEELDRVRVQMLERFLRPYVNAMRKASAGRKLSLPADHELRVEIAAEHLPENPLADFGVEKYVAECRQNLVTGQIIHPDIARWLPDVGTYFNWLES
ncbi:MAG TPA: hypothetical protein DCY13_08690 [Verrucomicrobiales bacterium]|nr:hypothetical protein [Verrucomicrobiales bacterium]